MSSATFTLDQGKIWSSGNGLTDSQLQNIFRTFNPLPEDIILDWSK